MGALVPCAKLGTFSMITIFGRTCAMQVDQVERKQREPCLLHIGVAFEPCLVGRAAAGCTELRTRGRSVKDINVAPPQAH